MISPVLFNRLRAAQLRSMREQELLSCSTWILICSLGHVLALVHPLFLLIHAGLLSTYEHNHLHHPALAAGATVCSGLFMLSLWSWSRYAPYRASLTALVSFVLIHTVVAAFDPLQLAFGTIFKVLVVLGLLRAVIVSHGRRCPH